MPFFFLAGCTTVGASRLIAGTGSESFAFRVAEDDSDSPQRTSHQMLSTSQLQSLAHGLFPYEEGQDFVARELASRLNGHLLDVSAGDEADLSVHEFFERFTASRQIFIGETMWCSTFGLCSAGCKRLLSSQGVCLPVLASSPSSS